MPYVELIILLILSIIQSIFGVGLLIFGTPIFLLLNYSFIESLNILLPISLLISFLQIISIKTIPKEFIKNLFFFSAPPLILTLYLINIDLININFKLIISILIIITSSFKLLDLNLNKLIKDRQKIIFFFIGLVHGFTNLGGSLLTILSTYLDDEKKVIRIKIAIGYFIFAFIQLIIINFNDLTINFTHSKFIPLLILIFFLSQLIFKRISSEKFSNYINIFAIIFGISIFLKELSNF